VSCPRRFTITCEDCGPHRAAAEPCAVFQCSLEEGHDGKMHECHRNTYSVTWLRSVAEREA
jgi:hypothetical protein